MRVNVRGVVMPSPVASAMENDEVPSPPEPSAAVLGPFFTKIVVFMTLAILSMFSTFFECMIAVWPKPCSAS